ncbi:MAG: MoxR family ATPase [Pseudomonadales bacterium]
MTSATSPVLASAQVLRPALAKQGYLAGDELLLTLILAHRVGKPVLLEGEAGVGKTAIAAALADAMNTELIRLQCYEGLDAAASLYEWDYAKQILHIRIAESDEAMRKNLEKSIFDEAYLLERPLLRTVRHRGPLAPVLLIDEIDRADEEFEAFLLEVLSEYQVSIPELGVLVAHHVPMTILTSNGTRELSDALRRRCLYLWIDLPSPAEERAIILSRVEGIQDALAEQIVNVMEKVRALDLGKPPGVSETLDWAAALVSMEREVLAAELVNQTAGCFLKSRDDIESLKLASGEWFAGESGT